MEHRHSHAQPRRSGRRLQQIARHSLVIPARLIVTPAPERGSSALKARVRPLAALDARLGAGMTVEGVGNQPQ